jgi:hypothetical protein
MTNNIFKGLVARDLGSLLMIWLNRTEVQIIPENPAPG